MRHNKRFAACVQTSIPAGTQPDAHATRQQLPPVHISAVCCSPPLIFSQGFVFLCCKTSFLEKRPTGAPCAVVYSSVKAPDKSYLHKRHRFFFKTPPLPFSNMSGKNIKARRRHSPRRDRHQLAFISNFQIRLQMPFKLGTLMASLGLIWWSAGLRTQQTAFMFADS